MSIEQAHAFLSEVERNRGLQKRLSKLKGREALAELVALAAGEGYTFTISEYRQAIIDVTDGELSDESLGEVRREMGLE
jgi:predicted ribosomally synthesized peptide with nif11-like leader